MHQNNKICLQIFTFLNYIKATVKPTPSSLHLLPADPSNGFSISSNRCNSFHSTFFFLLLLLFRNSSRSFHKPESLAKQENECAWRKSTRARGCNYANKPEDLRQSLGFQSGLFRCCWWRRVEENRDGVCWLLDECVRFPACCQVEISFSLNCQLRAWDSFMIEIPELCWWKLEDLCFIFVISITDFKFQISKVLF